MIAPLPPPVHGSAMMTQYIKDSGIINNAVEMDWVNLSTSRSLDEIGRKSIKKFFRFATSYLLTFWKLLIHRYDTCYLAITCHGIGFLKDAPFVLMCKLFKHKIILHQHNKGMADDVDRPIYRWLLPLVYRDTKVILLSQRLYPDIAKVVLPTQIAICPNGIPMCEKRPRHQRGNTVPRLLFLSNLIESKGVFVLLDACRILKERGLKFTCRFVGGETSEITRQRFEEEIKSRGLDETVIYAGTKYNDDKAQEFSNADIFIHPTLNDCFPLSLIEAMSHALPAISTNEGGIPDIISDKISGYITESHSPHELAIKIANMIEEPEIRRKMGYEAYHKFQSEFSIDKFEHRIHSILTSVNQSGGVKYVEYIGPKYGLDKTSELDNADIFIFPSFYKNECFPLVLLEAMQHSLPVITTDNGGIPDIVRHNTSGIITPPGSSTALADHIQNLIKSPELRIAIGQNGYNSYIHNYTITHFEQQILHCITD
jgi:glycosyltransferase involved in cell wall biosynthesis